MQRVDMATTESDPPPFQESGCQPKYFPPELVGTRNKGPQTLYCCYLIELNEYCYKRTQLQNIILALRTRLESDDEKLSFELNADGGSWAGQISYIRDVRLSNDEILRCRRFQVTLFRVLFDHNLNRLDEAFDRFNRGDGSAIIDYLLLPSIGPSDVPSIDWNIISSVLFPYEKSEHRHSDSCSRHGCRPMHTKNGLLFSCLLKNSLVCTPHNGNLYCIIGILDNLHGSSILKMGGRESITYKEYYKKKHGIELCFETEPFLNGRHIPKVQNYLHRGEARKARDAPVELPPELCKVVMSPVPIATFYSFSCVPSIMHRFESLLIASCLKKMCMGNCTQNVVTPTSKILEAITTNLCQEKECMESLETLGDSFLKYATSQHVFKTYPNDHQEGVLTAKRERMISNSQLYKLAYNRKIPGFIRDEQFDPKTWVIPGDYSIDSKLDEVFVLTSGKLYSRGRRNMENETIADVTEALIGAFLSTAGEIAALSFIQWLGLDVDFIHVPVARNFPMDVEELVNIKHSEFDSLLNYTFHDPSLLVEALTHGSYIPHGPQSYQRLEFLGDAVLDYAITTHFYYQYPGLSPECLTDLRCASVNNCCYALSSVKAGLHNRILCSSTSVQSFITDFVQNIEQSSPLSGWELETSFPKVVADIIESIAGAIYLDSGFKTDTVFEKIRPVLEPMVTPETLPLNPVKELNELCQKRKYSKEAVVTYRDGEAHMTLEVVANGGVHTCSSSARNKTTAMRLACKRMLKLLEPQT